MGSRASKLEAEEEQQTELAACGASAAYPISSILNQTPITVKTDFEIGNYLDPRSPSSCRTPIGEILQHHRPQIDIYQQNTPVKFLENPGGILRKKFLKGFTYNLHDPRSPSMQLNRTPIVFEDLDNTNERSFTLDDTFSDLLVETKAPAPVLPIETIIKTDKEAAAAAPALPKESPVATKESPIAIPPEVIQRDPRSPTMEVDRTPIIFTDDAPDDVEMIESVLEALSFNQQVDKPQNKPLERVKNNGKRRNKRKTRSNNIYEDNENVSSTPKTAGKLNSSLTKRTPARTPLGCVANKTNMRSRSVEHSGKSLKMRVPLTSYDDNNLSVAKVGKQLHFGNDNNENSFEIY